MSSVPNFVWWIAPICLFILCVQLERCHQKLKRTFALRKHPKTFLEYYKKLGDKGRGRPYRHIIASEGGVDYFFMIWPPGSKTAPHDHAGAFARIQIIAGSLYRVNNGNLKVIFASGSEILENDSSIHTVGNGSDSDWAASLHSFKYPEGTDYKMREYDGDPRNSRWVDGKDDIVLPNFHY